jgi:regulator of CtrA degradation
MGADWSGDEDVMFASDEQVSLAELMASGLFQRTYREGMQLVEESSAYLDGPGREVAKTLLREASLAYAGESMRLTTRLMQVAAWLLVRKAVEEGDMTEEQALADKYRLSSKEISNAPRLPGAQQLPFRLLDLIARSERLYARVERLDTQLRTQGHSGNRLRPLAQDLARVEKFFRDTLAKEMGTKETAPRQSAKD